MKKYFETLLGSPLFYEIQENQLAPMLTCLGAKVITCAKKEIILAEGDPADSIGIVLIGSAHIMRVDYFGNRSIVGRVGSGELFGESFACAGVKSMPVDVVANENSTLLLLDALRVMHPCDDACEFHRQLIYNLMQIMARKNLAFHQKIEVTSQRTTREKLMTYLMLQAKQHASNRFTIPYNRQELADYLEVDRSGLSAEISKLRAEKVLTCTRNSFELLTADSRY